MIDLLCACSYLGRRLSARPLFCSDDMRFQVLEWIVSLQLARTLQLHTRMLRTSCQDAPTILQLHFYRPRNELTRNCVIEDATRSCLELVSLDMCPHVCRESIVSMGES